MHKLFLDANTLLDFYRFGTDDLTQIEKLITLVEENEVEVLTNSLLEDEVSRMREAELSRTFGDFSSKKLSLKIPNYCEDIELTQKIKQQLSETNSTIAELANQIDDKIKLRELRADKLISQLFGLGRKLEITQEVSNAAFWRHNVKNPPGKKDSINDSVHWETLLNTQFYSTVDIVSRDTDFESDLNPGELKQFLKDEWNSKKKISEIYLFKSLSSYFKVRHPKIELSLEARKRELLEQLRNSGSFATTHQVIASLSEIDYFTRGQIGKLFEILLENSQVGKIAMDVDLRNFYCRFIEDWWFIPTATQETACELLYLNKDDYVFPF
ncbi:MAG: PIN domain-containing protein [Pseudomonadota bacterium]